MNRKKLVAALILVGIGAVMVLGFLYAGKPLLRFVGDTEQFRAWVDGHGIWGRIAFIGMIILQVCIAVIPCEPLELAAGYAFGTWEGTFLCLVGLVFGSMLVFQLVRRWGIKLVEVIFSLEKIHSLRFLQDSNKRNLLTFLLFFIPGTPKDLLSYIAGLTNMKMSVWLLLTSIARIPSILTSTISGNALGLGKYGLTALVFGGTLILSLFGVLLYRRMVRQHERQEPATDID